MIRANRTGRSLYTLAILSPFIRLQKMGAPEWVISAAVGVLGLLWQQMTVRILVVLMVSSAIDYWLGRGRAKRRGEFSPTLAHAGAIGKVAGIALVMLLLMLEHAIASVVHTGGLLSLAVAMGLLIVDLESIHDHRVKSGARPIPLFSQVISYLKTVAGRFGDGKDGDA